MEGLPTVVSIISLILNFGIGIFVGDTRARIKNLEHAVNDIREAQREPSAS